MIFLKQISIKNWLLIFFQIILFSLLQSCSGTQFGQRLKNSFDGSFESGKNSLTTEKKTINKTFSNKEKDKSLNKENTKSDSNISFSRDVKKRIAAPIKSDKAKELKPYRIIIKLYGEDPSAPAQIVTKALRNAGVNFEVEMIEKFEVDNRPKTNSGR